jgi:hypothetical protein
MLNWYGDDVCNMIMAATIKALSDTAFDPYVLALRDQMTTLSPPASQPGEPPHTTSIDDHQHLDDSICIWPDMEEQRVAVGSTLPYALYLEIGTSTVAPRPMWIETLTRLLDQMGRKVSERAVDYLERGNFHDQANDGDNVNPLTVDNAQPGEVAVGKQRSLPEG